MLTAKFDTFLFDQTSFIKFLKNGRVLFHDINLMKKKPIKIKSPGKQQFTTCKLFTNSSA